MLLESLKQLLENQQFECTLVSSDSNIPIDRLLVFLGTDSKERERIVEIIANQIEIPPEFSHPEAKSPPCNIIFRASLPFKINDLALNQVASLILFINQFLELPGFELNELEGKISYRYVWITHHLQMLDKEDSFLVMTIIGAMMLSLSLYGDMIESLSEGKLTFNDLLSQIVKMAEEGPSS